MGGGSSFQAFQGGCTPPQHPLWRTLFINESHNPNVDKIPHRIKLKVKLLIENERNFLTELIERNIRDISDQMIEIADQYNRIQRSIGEGLSDKSQQRLNELLTEYKYKECLREIVRKSLDRIRRMPFGEKEGDDDEEEEIQNVE